MSEELSCAEVSDLLDVVATDELAGVNLEERYPAILAHFRGCGRCRAAYFLWLDALRCQEEVASLYDRAASGATGSSPILSFLDAEEESMWRRRHADGASLFPLTFEIMPDFIRRTMAGPGLEGVREEASLYGEQEVLLLTDWVATEREDWVVQFIVRRRSVHPHRIDLEARLAGESPLPKGMRVCLSWRDQSRSALIGPDGGAQIRDLPLSFLVEAGSSGIKDDLIITFNVECSNESKSG